MTDNIVKLPVKKPEWDFVLRIKKQDDMYFITPVDGMEDECPLTFGAITDLGELEATLIGAESVKEEE